MAGSLDTFQDFLVNRNAPIDLVQFAISIILAAIISYILSKIYVRYGTALSNRKKFAGNFVLVTTTTTLIITVVKSSLALSLGLVGALSIIRFRAAIKEPEELVFLFLAISIGLGLGASQFGVTLVAFVIISLLIMGRQFYFKKEEDHNLYLTVSGKSLGDIGLKKVVEILKKHCDSVHLKRFDKSEDNFLEASFIVDFSSFEKLERAKEELNKLSKTITISYLDSTSTY